MLFFRFTSILTIFACSAAMAAENVDGQEDTLSCPLPDFTKLDTNQQAIEDGRIFIKADRSQIYKNEVAHFWGNVNLNSEGQQIKADSIKLNRSSSELDASGNINFLNNNVSIFADRLFASEEENGTSLSGSKYQLGNNPGHGEAGLIKVNLDGTLSLVDSSFTTCHGEVPDWQIKASEINISTEENHGEAYNARLKLFGVPVLYIPYISFPVTDERKSGFLYPKIGSSSSSGLEVEIPYYFNIAENMDATVAPKYMSKRGTQLLTTFRYLFGEQTGQLNVDYLADDKEINNNDARYLARWQHVGSFSDNFRLYVDYTTISDDNYLVDLDSDQYNSNDAYLYQIGELSYFTQNWQVNLNVQDFEVLGSHNPSYKTIPQIEISHWQALPWFNGQFEAYSELSRFRSDDPTLPTAERYHIEAGATFPISTPAWFFNSEFKLLQTNYHQDNLAVNSSLSDNVSRTLPKVRLHGGFNLERAMSSWKTGYTQTLEPQIQYLYIPNKDQSDIGVYDTIALQDDYDGLFRDRRFSGLDRIAQANQYSWGLTSRIYDNTNDEIFRLSLGRIVYLNDINEQENKHENNVADESVIASEVYFKLNQKWQFSSDIQYNTESSQTNKSQTNVDYQFAKNQAIQLNHRYTRDVSGTSLEQVSLLANKTINKNWQFVGRVTQDLQNKRSIESYAGLQYESCCWAIRFAYHRHLNSRVNDINAFAENRDEFDSKFMVEFVIKGLGGGNSRLSTYDMFNSSIFGYKRPYFLNN